jgi:hypothetical protein
MSEEGVLHQVEKSKLNLAPISLGWLILGLLSLFLSFMPRRVVHLLSLVALLTAFYMGGGFLQKFKDAGAEQLAKLEKQMNPSQQQQQQQFQPPPQGMHPYDQSGPPQMTMGASSSYSGQKMNIA